MIERTGDRLNRRYDTLDTNNKLIWNFRDIGHTMRHISEGKGSQKRILIVLLETGPITQRDLTRRLDIQPGSASEVIGKLETAGLLTRTPSHADHRTTDICLTKAGMVAAQEASTQREERHEKMFSCLPDEEKRILLDLLEKVNSSWDKLYRESEAGHSSTDKIFRKGHRKFRHM